MYVVCVVCVVCGAWGVCIAGAAGEAVLDQRTPPAPLETRPSMSPAPQDQVKHVVHVSHVGSVRVQTEWCLL